MIYATIVAILALVAAAVYLIARERSIATARIREHERLTRLHQQRESELLDRLAHAYDRPWVAPPIEMESQAQVEDVGDEDDGFAWDLSHLEEPTGVSF